MAASVENLALFLATRQKRLGYWQKTFTFASLPAVEQQLIAEKLATYALLLSKVARAPSDIERDESKERLVSLDRELNSLFEARRRSTSPMNPRDASTTIVNKPR